MASRTGVTGDLESRTGGGGGGGGGEEERVGFFKAKLMNEVDVAGGVWFRQGSHGEGGKAR
jgi:hypothetical protein